MMVKSWNVRILVYRLGCVLVKSQWEVIFWQYILWLKDSIFMSCYFSDSFFLFLTKERIQDHQNTCIRMLLEALLPVVMNWKPLKDSLKMWDE